MAVSIIVAAGANGQGPALSTIQDTLYAANGTRLNATAVITWNTFESSDGFNVGGQTLSVPIVDGSLYVQLVPNTTATPSVPYAVTYSSDGMSQWQEMWMVPPSASPLRLVNIRTSFISGGGTGGGSGGVTSGGGTSGPVNESDVTGLVSDLASRPLKGPSYGTGRVAIVDANGDVDTVLGNTTDCVYVNGTSGPCFDPTQLPTYSDNETPGGVVDGANTVFGLAAQPSPAQSLILFRNGMAQKQGFDYALTGQTVQFNAGAGPQPGDTIVAWYRLPSVASGGGNTGGPGGGTVQLPTLSTQVICSATGGQTTSATLTSLGTCTIPASFLGAGDRVEIRCLFAHAGTSTAFSYAVQWGGTTAIQRTGGTGDASIAVKADASITGGNTQLDGLSYGTVLSLQPFFANAAVSNAAPITIGFEGSMSAVGSDSVQLVNFTVTRFPAISHP